jgi:hypothetical protein
VLHTNLIQPYAGEFSPAGRSWLGKLPLEEDERLAIRRYLADLTSEPEIWRSSTRCLQSMLWVTTAYAD